MRKYILGIVLTLLIALTGVFNADTKALDNDYKNNLLKVDVSKVSGDTYTIDLFTQKPYNEPIKVRKKSDTSYYVLLPETYHSITSVQGSGDVSKVDVKLYPYAGQDLNNGYTKINIQTSKPVNFSTNVRTATKQVPSLDAKKLAQLDSAFDSKQSYTPQKETVKTVAPVKTAVAPVKVAPVVEPVKVNPVKTAEEPVKVASAQPQVAVQPQRNPHTANNEIEIVTKPAKQEPVKQEAAKPNKEPVNLEEVVDPDVAEDDSKLEEEAKEQGLTELAEANEVESIPALTLKQQVKQKVKAAVKIARDNLPVLLALLLLIIALRLLGTPKRKAQKAAPATDVSAGFQPVQPEPVKAYDDAVVEQPEPFVPVETPAVETLTPAVQNENDYEVYESHIEPAPAVEPIEVEAAGEPTETAPVVEEESEEAQVLASESFGDGRGLCLANFDGNIALVGYIGEEIFVIQNFGKITLINPSLQVRVAEQNDDSTVYIVKAANSKLMVKETKTFIGLEMVM